MGRREQKRAESVEKLLDAAEELFVQHGIANVSLEKVAAKAGLTRGAIYWNFADKEELALALIARRRRRNLESWDRSVSTTMGGGPHLASLHDWMDDVLRAGPEWFAFEVEALALTARGGRGEAGEQTQRVMLEQFMHLVQAQCSALGVDAPSDLEETAELVAALANGLVVAWLGDSRLPVARLFADGVVRLLGASSNPSPADAVKRPASGSVR